MESQAVANFPRAVAKEIEAELEAELGDLGGFSRPLKDYRLDDAIVSCSQDKVDDSTSDCPITASLGNLVGYNAFLESSKAMEGSRCMIFESSPESEATLSSEGGKHRGLHGAFTLVGGDRSNENCSPGKSQTTGMINSLCETSVGSYSQHHSLLEIDEAFFPATFIDADMFSSDHCAAAHETAHQESVLKLERRAQYRKKRQEAVAIEKRRWHCRDKMVVKFQTLVGLYIIRERDGRRQRTESMRKLWRVVVSAILRVSVDGWNERVLHQIKRRIAIERRRNHLLECLLEGERRRIAVFFQNTFLRYVKHLHHWEKINAATALQSIYRKYQGMKQMRLCKGKCSVRQLQFCDILNRESQRKLRRQDAFITKLQLSVQAWVFRRGCAVAIQRICRGFLRRSRFEMVKDMSFLYADKELESLLSKDVTTRFQVSDDIDRPFRHFRPALNETSDNQNAELKSHPLPVNVSAPIGVPPLAQGGEEEIMNLWRVSNDRVAKLVMKRKGETKVRREALRKKTIWR